MPVLNDLINSYLLSRDFIVGGGPFQNLVEKELRQTVLEEIQNSINNLTDGKSWTPQLKVLFKNELKNRIYKSDGATFLFILQGDGSITSYVGFDEEYNGCDMETVECQDDKRMILSSYDISNNLRKEILKLMIKNNVLKVKIDQDQVTGILNSKTDRVLNVNKGNGDYHNVDVVQTTTFTKILDLIKNI